MTGPQTEIEIRLWCDEFFRMRQTPEWTDAAMDAADALVADYRARYGLPQPTAPEAVWYDEPPFPKDGQLYPCWIAGKLFPAAVFWNVDEWQVGFAGEYHARSLRGRRVSPIVKPQDPPQ